MHKSSVNLPPLGASTELISCAWNPFVFDLMRICQPRVEQYISKKGNNFG